MGTSYKCCMKKPTVHNQTSEHWTNILGTNQLIVPHKKPASLQKHPHSVLKYEGGIAYEMQPFIKHSMCVYLHISTIYLKICVKILHFFFKSGSLEHKWKNPYIISGLGRSVSLSFTHTLQLFELLQKKFHDGEPKCWTACLFIHKGSQKQMLFF